MRKGRDEHARKQGPRPRGDPPEGTTSARSQLEALGWDGKERLSIPTACPRSPGPGRTWLIDHSILHLSAACPCSSPQPSGQPQPIGQTGPPGNLGQRSDPRQGLHTRPGRDRDFRDPFIHRKIKSCVSELPRYKVIIDNQVCCCCLPSNQFLCF